MEEVTHRGVVGMAAGDAREFARDYLAYVADLLSRLDVDAIANLVEVLDAARERGSTIFLIGNGGSAATASHMANDIGLDVLKKSGGARAFRVLALTDSVPMLTAIANDEGYENVFLHQLRILYRPGDVLVAISASGNSPNVVAAAEWVRQQRGAVLGLVGFDGGRLKGLCDVAIHVVTPKGAYGPVEDVHMIMDHLVAGYLSSRATLGG
jgi:D-sedoheptulose 7-phosphate isomerase